MKDQISALVDGEVSVENSVHVFTALKNVNELGESWATYHLIGDVMRSAPIFRQDFTERLMQKLDNEPAVLAPRSALSTEKTPVKTSAAWSVAASVAAVMFVGWMVLQQQVQTGTGINSVEIAKTDIQKSISSEYLVAHQSYAPSNAAYIQPAAYAENGK